MSLILKLKAAGMSNAYKRNLTLKFQDLIKHNPIIQRIVK